MLATSRIKYFSRLDDSDQIQPIQISKIFICFKLIIAVMNWLWLVRKKLMRIWKKSQRVNYIQTVPEKKNESRNDKNWKRNVKMKRWPNENPVCCRGMSQLRQMERNEELAMLLRAEYNHSYHSSMAMDMSRENTLSPYNSSVGVKDWLRTG